MRTIKNEANADMAIMSRFLREDVTLPNSKSSKDELWEWIQRTITEMRIIRRTFLNASAAQMVKADNPLYNALESLLSAMESANPEWWKNVGAMSEVGDPVAQAWEKLNNVRNGIR